MSEAILVVLKFLGSGAFMTLCLFVYNRIKTQAAESREQSNKIDQSERDITEMKNFFNKITDATSIRLGEITSIQKDHAKDIEQLKQNDKKFENIVDKIFDKQESILKIVTDIRIEMAKNER